MDRNTSLSPATSRWTRIPLTPVKSVSSTPLVASRSSPRSSSAAPRRSKRHARTTRFQSPPETEGFFYFFVGARVGAWDRQANHSPGLVVTEGEGNARRDFFRVFWV